MNQTSTDRFWSYLTRSLGHLTSADRSADEYNVPNSSINPWLLVCTITLTLPVPRRQAMPIQFLAGSIMSTPAVHNPTNTLYFLYWGAAGVVVVQEAGALGQAFLRLPRYINGNLLRVMLILFASLHSFLTLGMPVPRLVPTRLVRSHNGLDPGPRLVR